MGMLFIRSLGWCLLILLFFEEDRIGIQGSGWTNCDGDASDWFFCTKEICIFKDWLCDGDNDCDNGRDEDSTICDGDLQCRNNTEFSCGNRCIPVAWRCDGQGDCDDGRDEVNCKRKCRDSEFGCSANNSVPCIRKTWVCDGDPDCPSGIDERNCSVKCPMEKFLCDVGSTCISKDLLCNGNRDCRDGSDETDCSTNTTASCGPNQVRCVETRECIPISYLCDHDLDCADGSDEAPFVCAERSCANDEWRCLGSKQCVNITDVCNGVADCHDKSDERQHLSTPGSSCLQNECLNRSNCGEINCQQTPVGPHCYCDPGYKQDGDKKRCVDVNECEDNVCAQFCVNLNGSFKCACYHGYHLVDHFYCRPDDTIKPMILVSQIDRIINSSVDGVQQNILHRNLKRAVALDYHYQKKLVFFTDVLEKKIYRTRFGSKEVEPIFSAGLYMPDGIAVDWIGENIYFTESRGSRIDVVNLEGRYRHVLVHRNLGSPRGLAVDPQHRYLFYTDWGSRQPKVGRCSMDGQACIILIDKNITWPNAITLDYINQRVYWADARLDMIFVVDYDGRGRRVVAGGPGRTPLPHPFAITLYRSFIYVTDWQDQEVYKVDLLKQGEVTKVIKHMRQPMDIQIYHPARQNHSRNLCKDYGCSQLALLSAVSPSGCRCACEVGTELLADGKTCKRLEEFVIVARKTQIRGYIFENGTRRDAVVPVLGLRNAVAVDYDVKEEMLYFSDSSRLYRVRFDGAGMQSLVNESLGDIDGLAVDWVARNLYWTDGRLKTISVARLDGKYRRTLIKEDLGRPRAVVVHPKEGYLFWSDWGHEPKIERSEMDGTNRRTIVDGGDLHWPNGLTIDFAASKLYWIDARHDHMKRANFDGNETVTVLEGLVHPFGLDVHAGYAYWSDWHDMTIYRIKMSNMSSENKEPLLTNVGGLMEIRAYRRNLVSRSNACNTSSCAQLCLLNKDGHRCACKDGFVVAADAGNCTFAPSTVPPAKATCRPDRFLCNNSRCVPNDWLCDNDDDCLDNSDETNQKCLEITCPPSQRKCSNNRCVPEALFCDGDDDCGNNYDEQNCNCSSDHFKCKNGICIPNSWKCDDVEDCSDGSDEVGCNATVTCAGFTCASDGACLPRIWQCNGRKDCDDNSDERDCAMVNCSSNEFQCKDGECIEYVWKCDGDDDCDDKSDEANCTSPTTPPACPSSKFRCHTTLQCIEPQLKCDGHWDCSDASDESVSVCNTTCKEKGLFQCSETHCINQTRVCDGSFDCEDRSDENCCFGAFRCANNRCILEPWKCDDQDDCGDNSDETVELCGTCKFYQFLCPNSTICINRRKLCDTVADCPGGEDEAPRCIYQQCGTDNGGCSHNCSNTPEGSLCSCPKWLQLDVDNHTCVDKNECELPWTCSQLCVNQEKHYLCSCTRGYQENAENTCKAISDEEDTPYILYSNRVSIRKIPLVGKGGRVRYSEIVSGLRNAIGVDFDWQERRIYWTDVLTDKIQRAKFDGSQVETVVSGGLISAEGIAVDWIGRNLYWLDMRADKIEVAKLNGTQRSVLINKDIDSPRAMQVDPSAGLIFWTDWGSRPRIEKAFMDGTNRTVIIDTKLYWPNGMTLDYPTKRLYWVDAHLHHLEFCDYDGKNRYLVQTGTLNIQRPFSSSLFEDTIYWTDWIGNAIRYTHKYPGGVIRQLHNTSSRIMDLHVVHPAKQQIGVNHCANSQCSHICALKPNGSSCLCPIGKKIDPERPNNCIGIDSFLIYSRRSEIRAMSLNDDGTDRMIPIVGLKNAIGVDFDYVENRVYWSDVTDNSISKISVDGTGYEKIIKPHSGLFSPDGIAVDWVAKNVYWTDSVANVIAVARSDGRFHKTLLYKAKHTHQPRGIALHPVKGFMFWTDWGHKTIQRATLNGKNIKILMNESLNYVNGLTIDYQGDRIYWVEAAYDKIESSNLDGGDRNTVKDDGIEHPFGITIFKGVVYWTDWMKRAISKVDINSKNSSVVKSGLQGIMDVCVYDKSRQIGSNPCGRNNGNCPELCFWTGKNVDCGCRSGFTFNKQTQKCEQNQQFLLYALSNQFIGVSFNPNDNATQLPYISVTVTCYAADFHYNGSAIYFTDDTKNVIGRINTDGSGLRYVITHGLMRPHGIAVDWVGEQLYWTDMGTKLVEVSRLNGSYRMPLISHDLEKPRAIVLYPSKGLMFWSDWGKVPKIERAHMDGSQRKPLMANRTDFIYWPNGLTIDYETDMLYWIDGRLNHVGRMGLNGENPRIVLKSADTHRGGYSLTVLGDYIYAAFTQSKNVIRIEKEKNASRVFHAPRTIIRGATSVVAYHKSRQAVGGPCHQHRCEQLCLPFGETNYRCACGVGELSDDGKHCHESSAFLAYAVAKDIRFLHLDGMLQGAPYSSITNNSPTVGLDYDYQEQLIFFSVLTRSIIRVHFNGSVMTELKINVQADGVSVDWRSKKVYLTDAVNDKIRKMNYDGSDLRDVISFGMSEPRAIVVMPCDDMLYWTDWGIHSIEAANMNGINRRKLITSDVIWPNGLTIDTIENRMFWVDAKLDRIESADLDGSNRRVVLDKLPHPFAISVYGSTIFWTDWMLRKVTRANKLSGGSQRPLTSQGLTYKPMDIHVVSSSRQNCSSNPCYNNGGCSHLCTVKQKTKQCSCRPGYKLLDDYWCVPENSNCAADRFTCANGKCISRLFVCDTDNDCGDNSDEMDVVCARHVCRSNQFQCSNGKCIPKRWRCDYENDCKDNSDEEGCERQTCSVDQFTCNNGRCIDKKDQCDEYDDCRDFSDEAGCPPVTCRAGRIPCSNNGRCISQSWLCDGYDDCGDNSDEAMCSNITCSDQEMKCANTGRCIPIAWRCDGEDDCGDQSDETTGNCTKTSEPCKAEDFTCDSGSCVSQTFLCDGDNDCGDNSDETQASCGSRTCGVLEFKCYNTSRCIPRTYVCDGDNDCGDASDEHPREGCTHPSCDRSEFRCDNGICIRKSWHCDHANDCGDLSDERNCKYATCQPHQFTCGNGHCISSEYKCDHDRDCDDGSDEIGCGPVTTPKPCSEDKFQCKNTTYRKCIDLSLVCNKISDCEDHSDEKNCFLNHCVKEKHNCDFCNNTKTGFKCSCYSGKKLVNKTNCVDINECLDHSINRCEQMCVNTDGSFKCQCSDNYKLSGQHSCKPIDPSVYPHGYLLFSDRYDIRKLSLDGKDYHTLVSELINVVAVDYDLKEQRIFWSTNSPKGIKSAKMDGTDIKTIIRLTHSSPDGMAVDWVGRNLYFCEAQDAAIFVSRLNGFMIKKLVTGLHEPRGMAVYPETGYLFFTDWGQRAIFRVGMNGKNLTKIIEEKVVWPNGITIDYISKELFWVDARLDVIEYADMDGQNRRRVSQAKVSHPFAITVFEENIYWTDWLTKAVHKANKWNGGNHKIIRNTTSKPMDIQVVHPVRQPAIVSPCPTKNPCQGLCLLTPGGGYECACPMNSVLQADERSCLSKCTGEFACTKSLKCIPSNWLCDGEDDCGDGSDEESCAETKCPPGQFSCDNDNCTSIYYKCDGDDDCGDMSDERDCPRVVCSLNNFKCDNEQCVSRQSLCDGVNDCGDGSDEKNCTLNRNCSADEMKCPSTGLCIPLTAKCNGQLDCPDGSDESQCEHMKCAKGEFKCPEKCIDLFWVCDGDHDCLDGSDEAKCKACPADKFTCANKKCVPKTWRCDRSDDCGDKSDEMNCTYSACSSNSFRCKKSQRCINRDWVCDGHDDCGDKSDEDKCEHRCTDKEFTCKDKYCIHKEWRCDGTPDCRDFSDEIGCDDKRCSSSQYKCKNTLCINMYSKCDGRNDCGDNSDEDPIMCAKHSCSLIQTRCKNEPVCIPSYKVCDGENDCLNGTDETGCTKGRSCNDTEFKCADGLTCVDLTAMCNQRIDCPDKSDETKCSGSCSSPLLGVCQHKCENVHPGPGYHCVCRSGYEISKEDSHYCEDINECAVFGKCSQKCENVKGSFKCSCYDGYQLSHNNNETICKIKGSPPEIYVPSHQGIRKYSPSGFGGNLLVPSDSVIKSIDYFVRKNGTDVLWLDGKKNTINLATIEDKNQRRRRDVEDYTTLVQATGKPQSFAVDWMGGNIIWLESRPTNHSVRVQPIFGKSSKALCKIETYNQPTHIILYLEKRKMFWCDVGLVPKIEVANLNGTDRKVLQSEVTWPTGLAIDGVADRLYWCDMKENTIETVFTNGTDRRVVLNSKQLKGEFSEPYSIDVFEDYLYIVTKKGFAFKWSKFGRGIPVKLASNGVPESRIKVYHRARQTHVNEGTKCEADTCSHICMPSDNGTVCLCPNGKVDQKICEADNASCVGYCVRGTCQINDGKPSCQCPQGTTGKKCQLSCADLKCENGGVCYTNKEQLKCRCLEDTTGERCELTCADHKCVNNGTCVVHEGALQCRCKDNEIRPDCPDVQARSGDSDKIKLLEIVIPCTFGLLVIIAIVSILCCRCRGRPSRKFSSFYGSRKASFTYTGMTGEDEEDDFAEPGSRQFVINDNEVNFANPVYNSLFLEGPSIDDYAEVNRQLIFEDGDSKVDFSNPMYDSYYGSNENPEMDLFLPRTQSHDAVSSGDSYGSHDSLTTRLVKDEK